MSGQVALVGNLDLKGEHAARNKGARRHTGFQPLAQGQVKILAADSYRCAVVIILSCAGTAVAGGRIRITDTGAGIAASHLGIIGQRGTRENRTDSKGNSYRSGIAGQEAGNGVVEHGNTTQRRPGGTGQDQALRNIILDLNIFSDFLSFISNRYNIRNAATGVVRRRRQAGIHRFGQGQVKAFGNSNEYRLYIVIILIMAAVGRRGVCVWQAEAIGGTAYLCAVDQAVSLHNVWRNIKMNGNRPRLSGFQRGNRGSQSKNITLNHLPVVVIQDKAGRIIIVQSDVVGRQAALVVNRQVVGDLASRLVRPWRKAGVQAFGKGQVIGLFDLQFTSVNIVFSGCTISRGGVFIRHRSAVAGAVDLRDVGDQIAGKPVRYRKGNIYTGGSSGS